MHRDIHTILCVFTYPHTVDCLWIRKFSCVYLCAMFMGHIKIIAGIQAFSLLPIYPLIHISIHISLYTRFL